MKVFLCGGGADVQTVDANRRLNEVIEHSKPCLYVPLAMEAEQYDGCYEWITGELAAVDVPRIDMVRSAAELAAKNLADYSFLFIGGGNTFKLLHELKSGGAYWKIRDYLAHGGVAFGGSAGAIIFGADLEACRLDDDNDAGLTDVAGFDVLNGVSILCHYTNRDAGKDEHSRQYLLELSSRRRSIALPEEVTLFVNGDAVEVIGDRPFYLFENGSVRELRRAFPENEPAIPLTGGCVTQGVVRLGGHVRRPQCANSEFVHDVLTHLERKGVSCAPRYLGIDSKSREILSFMPGSVPDNLGEYSPEQCARAAEIIRTLHDALRDFPGLPEGMTVCHFDLSPCNFTFVNGMPSAVIDWDACRFGEPIDDLAYAAWMWLDVGNDENDPASVRAGVEAMMEAYGAGDRGDFIARMLRQMQRVGASIFPTEEQTLATRRWTENCRRWAEEHLL